MVRSMVAGIAGLKTHQSKLDVIGNNIANVNTWGFKSSSFNFQDSMYANSINSAGGDTMGGAAGGRNASQVGYGVTTSSITASFQTGAPSPSSNPMDCMIDGTGFFLVGNMINGSFTNVADSGLNLSRVGIFRVDGNGYLVDDQRSYVYGYAVKPGTGIPETPATKGQYSVTGASVQTAAGSITIGGYTVQTTKTTFKEQVQDWIKQAVRDANSPFANYQISLKNYKDPTTAGGNDGTVDLTLTANASGVDANVAKVTGANWGTGVTPVTVTAGAARIPGVEAQYEEGLSTLVIPEDDKGEQYKIQNYKINEDGTVVGVDEMERTIIIGKLALITVENPEGLEKSAGYYYSIGPNAGTTTATTANGGPAGVIKGGYLEMANVDLASEFSQMITTQRGFQANSKIITVTDQMLEELVNMKR